MCRYGVDLAYKGKWQDSDDELHVVRALVYVGYTPVGMRSLGRTEKRYTIKYQRVEKEDWLSRKLQGESHLKELDDYVSEWFWVQNGSGYTSSEMDDKWKEMGRNT